MEAKLDHYHRGIAWLLFAISSFFLTILSFRYKAYALREHDVIYRSGWLVQSVRVCPFNRIQHCSVDSGVIDRRYGLSSLSVYTAGGAEADMKLAGLPKDVADDMRDFILSKTNKEHSA
ncbi:MAG: PH domain-containing protein [Chitinophagaceae bacterium]|nr:PH domain-containing protein [Chitinophagaceae bacterium]